MTGTGNAPQARPHLMTERETLKRKILLKRQAVKGIQGEIRDLKTQLFLLDLRDRFVACIDRDPGRELSRQLDSVTFLIESLGNGR